MSAWWKSVEKRKTQMTPVEIQLAALDRAEKNMLKAIDQSRRRLVKICMRRNLK